MLTTSIHPVWVNTPLIAPYEKSLRAAGSPIIEPPVVANAIADNIFKCSGGQVFLPSSVAKISHLRGFPNWAQETVRAAVAKSVLPSVQ